MLTAPLMIKVDFRAKIKKKFILEQIAEIPARMLLRAKRGHHRSPTRPGSERVSRFIPCTQAQKGPDVMTLHGTQNPSLYYFEQGPIRPPSEAGSLLLRFTRNCPWNQCTFCPVYKGQGFSRRSLEEILGDIDTVAGIIQDLKELSIQLGQGGEVNRRVLNHVLSQPQFTSHQRSVAFWHAAGKGTVFIQDANSLLLPTETLVQALQHLYEKVPGVERVTSYARSSTLNRKSLEELERIRRAGLHRIHVGLESGSDIVLKMVRKGCTADDHIGAGRKVIQAGMSLSMYVMPGLGGKQWSEEHALETARVLNAVDPQFIRLRSLRIPSRAPLHEDKVSGRFTPLTDDETVQEIRLLIESLEGIHSTLTSDHIMNLLERVSGTFPHDKASMLSVIDAYLALSDEERLLFRLGRRGGALQSIEELQHPVTRQRLERARMELEKEAGVPIDQVIDELADRYI